MSLTFQRPYSDFIASYFSNLAAIGSNSYNSEIAIEVTLQDSTVLRYSTASLLITHLSQGAESIPITPLDFVARIQGKPDIKHTQTAQVDLSGLTLVNLDYLISQMIPDNSRPFDNATVRLYLCFPRGGGDYEGLIYFDGRLIDVIGDDAQAQISIESDVASKLAIVGKEITQRCVNELGDSFCGVGFLPLGAVCTKIFEDKVSGCAFWQGVFNGVPFLAPSSAVPGYNGPAIGGGGGTGGGTNGGGWDDPPDGCPDLSMYFKSANGGFLRGHELKVGEAIIWNDTPVVVTQAEVIEAKFRYLVRTQVGAAAVVSASHHFLTSFDDDKGKAAHSIFGGHDDLIARVMSKRVRVRPMNNEGTKRLYTFQPVHSGKVLRLAVSYPHKYECGITKEAMLESHNKPIGFNLAY